MKQKNKKKLKNPSEVEKVMHEFKEGTLPIGKSKKKVKNRRQGGISRESTCLADN